MIEHFLNENKSAIKYIKHHRVISKDFKELYQDIYKMIALISKNRIKPHEKIGVFVMPYSYTFYVLFFACVLYEINLVIFDSYKKQHIKKLMEMEGISSCFVDDKLKIISYFVLPKCKKINCSSYPSFSKENSFIQKGNPQSVILTTFTSGTTGTPKAINRTLDFLLKQVEEIQNEIDLSNVSILFGGLPIYNVLSLYLLNTTCISRRLKYMKKFESDCVLTNIQKILQEKRNYPFVKRVMIGGAILYSSEAKKIKSIFPNAEITYVYGASEGAIIYRTNLEFYEDHLFTFDSRAKEIEVTINRPNENGIGEIVIQGEKVNAFHQMYYTGDIGKISDGKLMIYGRKKYSSLEDNFYNYVFDESLRNENKIEAFSFYYKKNIYVVSKEKIKKQQKNIIYMTMSHLPKDLKHKTKLNYQECIKRIEKLKQ